MADYNYSVFDLPTEMKPFGEFPKQLGVGERAPDFPLEDLDSAQEVRMKSLWARRPAVIEFGSFT